MTISDQFQTRQKLGYLDSLDILETGASLFRKYKANIRTKLLYFFHFLKPFDKKGISLGLPSIVNAKSVSQPGFL